jgi:arylsulfatase A
MVFGDQQAPMGQRVEILLFGTQAGSVCETPIISMDFYLTLLEATGTTGDKQHNAAMDGQSIIEQLKDPARPIERDLFWHYPHYPAGGNGP